MIVAGPLCEFSSMTKIGSGTDADIVSDYIVQASRFGVIAGFGCTNDADNSVLSLLLLSSWPVFLALISITVYYRMSTTHIDMIGLSEADMRQF